MPGTKTQQPYSTNSMSFLSIFLCPFFLPFRVESVSYFGLFMAARIGIFGTNICELSSDRDTCMHYTKKRYNRNNNNNKRNNNANNNSDNNNNNNIDNNNNNNVDNKNKTTAMLMVIMKANVTLLSPTLIPITLPPHSLVSVLLWLKRKLRHPGVTVRKICQAVYEVGFWS